MKVIKWHYVRDWVELDVDFNVEFLLNNDCVQYISLYVTLFLTCNLYILRKSNVDWRRNEYDVVIKLLKLWCYD